MHMLFDIPARRADISPDATAFIDDETGRSLSYRALHERVARMVSALRARGVAQHDRVAVLCLNRVEVFELLFAVGRIGAVLVPLNWRQPAAELAPILADCRPVLLLHDEEHAGVAAALAQGAELAVLPLGAFEDELAAAPLAQTDTRVDPDALWYLLYTSGTTGKPKAVIQTPQMAWVNAINIGGAVDLVSTDRTLCFLPLFHTAGLNLYAMPTLIQGGCVRLLRKFDVARIIALLAQGAVTKFFGVPAIYQALALHPDFDRMDFSPVQSWGSGGAALPEPVIRQFLARGIAICSGMGMTETGPTVFLMDAASVPHKLGSVGKARMLVEVRIADGEDRPLPDGEAGELQIRGPGVTPGYWHNPEATAAAFSADGWLKSGDVARKDRDGYVYIVDRIKDMFISGGENVYPAEVEAVLHAHPDILETSVVGVPDARWGEVGAAFILPRPGRNIQEEDVRTWCRTRLAGYKIPKRLIVVDDFPRTAAGKIRKPELRQRAREED